MKRREALKNLGMGVTAGLVLPAWLTACSDDSNGPEVKYDGVVGIVGAGAAGLAVADYLISKGIKVKIFEASGRIGGRIKAIKPSDPIYNELAADFHVELGADRIFGTDSEFGNLIKLLKVPTVKFREEPTNAQDYYIINDEYSTQAEAEARGDFQALKIFRETGLAAYTGGGSVQDAAATTSDLQPILNSWLGNAYGSSADRIGANALGEALSLIEHDKKEFMLVTNPISDVLTSKYARALKRVTLNSAIKAVNYSGAGVTLTVLDTDANTESTVEVTKLVVTSPVNVLKDSSLISFSPALPASKTSALSRIGMDASIRIILEFTRNNFFKKPDGTGPAPAFIYGGVECPSYFFSGVGRSDKNLTVSLTINGPKAEELRALATDDERIQRILDEMDVVFDGKASLNIRKRFPEDGGTIISVIKDWTAEPYILGGQSYPLVGGTNDDRVALAEPIADKIFFAGEATDVTGEFGTISGAIKSGERAAEEVVAAILEENASA
ncbi:MAG: FAD-dependent oxidoreductase [Cyclobacteriaceae bacterium]|nr:FAD-dependent oxidoreductase [Cyclobacteriaceae bacterium]